MGRLMDRIDALEERLSVLEFKFDRRPMPGRPPSKSNEAAEFLNDLLDRPMKWGEVRRQAVVAGLNPQTVRNTAERVGIIRHKGWWSFKGRNMEARARQFLLDSIKKPRHKDEVIAEGVSKGIKKEDMIKFIQGNAMDYGPLWYPYGEGPRTKSFWTPKKVKSYLKTTLRNPMWADEFKALLKRDGINFHDAMDEGNELGISWRFDQVFLGRLIPDDVLKRWLIRFMSKDDGSPRTERVTNITKEMAYHLDSSDQVRKFFHWAVENKIIIPTGETRQTYRLPKS